MTSKNSKNQVEDLQPYSGSVDIEKLLNGIETFIFRHTILPKGAAPAIILWCLATYLIDKFRIFPRLTIFSPDKRCGKSTLLDLIEALSFKALITSNMSVATIYRMVDAYRPTLIIDEADTFVARNNSDMLGIINSGHAKNRAYVDRCDGDDFKPKRFSTWAPMVLAAIGTLQPTIMDRSIKIPIKRKSPTEMVQRIPSDLRNRTKTERSKLLKWAGDHAAAIQANPIEPPKIGNDRAVDNWLPLFTIAHQISPAWVKKCEDAYRQLEDFEEDPTLSTQLLTDIRGIFQERSNQKISSAELLEQLNSFQDKPWCELKNGRPMSQRGLANLLKPYGVKPAPMRVEGISLRGYELQQFEDAFERYLPPLPSI